MSEPLPNGTNGRDAQGRFTVGWRGGPGNPFVRQSAALRQAMLEAVTPEDMRVIIQKLVEKAKTGDMAATKLVLLWTCGKPHEPYEHVATEGGPVVEEPEEYGADGAIDDLTNEDILAMSPGEAEAYLEEMDREDAGRYLKILLLHRRARKP